MVYERELAKSEAFDALKHLRKHVNFLHEAADLRLQPRTEQPGKSDAVLTKKELARILERRLISAGFEETEAIAMAESLLRLSTERLVMLVSRKPGRFEFEVRSLQEYMAARALTDGQDDAIVGGLKNLVASSHWRNTWLLAAGRLLRYREHLLDVLVSLVTEYDARVAEAPVTLIGSSLAGDLYLDNVASEFPAARRKLLTSAMKQFGDTSTHMPRQLIDIVDRAIPQSERETEIALSALHDLARANLSSRAAKYLSEHQSGMDPVAKQARATLNEGRKYVKPGRASEASRYQVLAGAVVQQGEIHPELSHFVDLLRVERDPGSGTVLIGSEALLPSLDSLAVRELLVRVAIANYQIRPDIADYASSLLCVRASRLTTGQRFS